ncbi:hypothetical protein [Gibbsiella quercinecans]|uniref:hypothetical protein n=1 Tax=Gibbsiella quercinecans TaxID=929813 RepID=UPI001E5074DE|nr:hypothetical protein [Gibbsiella quercinecans]
MQITPDGLTVQPFAIGPGTPGFFYEIKGVNQGTVQIKQQSFEMHMCPLPYKKIGRVIFYLTRHPALKGRKVAFIFILLSLLSCWEICDIDPKQENSFNTGKYL